MDSYPFLNVFENSIELSLKVQPRTSRSGPLGVLGEDLKWGVHSAPTDGQANKELIASVAKFFGVSKSSVTILRGLSSRQKQVSISDLDQEKMLVALDGVL